MKKVIILLILGFLLLGCGEGYNRGACFRNVANEFPNAKISVIGERGFQFIVKTLDGDIWYVETGNGRNANISLKAKLF
jgi:hypothetical protein